MNAGEGKLPGVPATPVAFAAITAAVERLRPYLEPTPVLAASELDELTGASVFLKAELFQKTGAYKARGALNAMLRLDATGRARGVVAHSSGNHGIALAWSPNRRPPPRSLCSASSMSPGNVLHSLSPAATPTSIGSATEVDY